MQLPGQRQLGFDLRATQAGFSGQVQIAESKRARAVTMDCETWEIHFIHKLIRTDNHDGKKPTRGFRRAAVIDHDQLKKIAEIKMPDLNANDMDGAIKIIAGTARSMGIEVKKVVSLTVGHDGSLYLLDAGARAVHRLN